MAVNQQHQTDTDSEKVLVAKDDAGPPAWELKYDDPEKTTIVHHHGTKALPTSYADRGDGRWVAKCSECGASLEIRGTPEQR